MNILLLSDTHSYIDEAVLKHVAWADEVWHAGDIGDLKVTDAIQKLKPLRAVHGNIDNAEIRQEFPENLRFMAAGVDVWITHIGGYPGRYDQRIRDEIKRNPPKLFISGHSHILKVMRDPSLDLMHMNPGAAGKHGLHKVRTVLRFCINNGALSDLEVVEFKR